MEALARRSTTPNRQLRNFRAKFDRILECHGFDWRPSIYLEVHASAVGEQPDLPREHRQMPRRAAFRDFLAERIPLTPEPSRSPSPFTRERPLERPHAFDRPAGRIGSTPTVPRMQHSVYRDETLYESDARCSNRNRQIQ